MKILGLNCYGHDSAATLTIDGKVVFATEEERMNREKHSGAFPIESIKAALNYENITISDIDHVVVSWDPSISYSKIPTYVIQNWKTLPILISEMFTWKREENLGMLTYLKDIKNIPNTLQNYFPDNKINFKFHMLNHHMSHAASCYYPSGFEKAAILTIDGAGEWSTCMLGYGDGLQINTLDTVDTPYSLGAFYQAISRYLGFKLLEGPGKLMGLAPYGDKKSNEYYKLKKLITLLPSGKFEIDMDYFAYHYTRKTGVSKKFIELFGEENKNNAKEWTKRELNIAAAAQEVVEETILHMATILKKRTNAEYLCMAGGVALNSVANGLIAKSGLYKEIFIQPATGDSGTSLGATLLLHNNILKKSRNFIQKDSFLGPSYSSDDYKEALDLAKLDYKQVEEDDLYSEVAKIIQDGNIVSWFQGRMEFGPRALGNRSFLATPLIADMKDILNKRVKFREPFRPFAAIVLEEDVGKYFDFEYKNPYMLFVFNVREKYKNIIPAITHVDGSCRIQTVNKEENPHIYKLLLEFKKLTGHSIVINTSYNIKGEPIVCSPKEAINSYMNADVDCLIMGNYISMKK